MEIEEREHNKHKLVSYSMKTIVDVLSQAPDIDIDSNQSIYNMVSVKFVPFIRLLV